MAGHESNDVSATCQVGLLVLGHEFDAALLRWRALLARYAEEDCLSSDASEDSGILQIVNQIAGLRAVSIPGFVVKAKVAAWLRCGDAGFDDVMFGEGGAAYGDLDALTAVTRDLLTTHAPGWLDGLRGYSGAA